MKQTIILMGIQASGKSSFAPPVAIVGTSNKLEMPSLSEGFDQLYYAIIENGTFSVLDWMDDHAI